MVGLQQLSDKIWPGWTIERCLGRSAYSIVYHIVKNAGFGHQLTAALKVIPIPGKAHQHTIHGGMDEGTAADYYQSIAEDVVEEIVFISNLKGHTNIVSYEDFTIMKSDNGIQWTILVKMELLTPLKPEDFSQGKAGMFLWHRRCIRGKFIALRLIFFPWAWSFIIS